MYFLGFVCAFSTIASMSSLRLSGKKLSMPIISRAVYTRRRVSNIIAKALRHVVWGVCHLRFRQEEKIDFHFKFIGLAMRYAVLSDESLLGLGPHQQTC